MTTVWVVEDDPDIAEGCQLALESAGFAVHLCRSGQQALAWIETQPAFDVVILDLHLPEVSGEAVLSAIQGRWKDARFLWQRQITCWRACWLRSPRFARRWSSR